MKPIRLESREALRVVEEAQLLCERAAQYRLIVPLSSVILAGCT